jgi:hypothetical protein
MSEIAACDLIAPYLRVLDTAFHVGEAPDGTTVVATPFEFVSGDPVEITIWRENGRIVLTDRGGLSDALLLFGVDAVESSVPRAFVDEAVTRHGASFGSGVISIETTPDNAGLAFHALIQSIMDAQVAGQGAFHRPAFSPEPVAYSVVREVLDSNALPYREKTTVSGRIGKRYPVDFQFAFRRGAVQRGIVVVACERNALLFAERWNFRFRDIRQRRPSLHRVVMVDEQASWRSWTQRSGRVIREECEGLFFSKQPDAFAGYLLAG